MPSDPLGRLYVTFKERARHCGHQAFVAHTGTGEVHCLTCGATKLAWPAADGGVGGVDAPGGAVCDETVRAVAW